MPCILIRVHHLRYCFLAPHILYDQAASSTNRDYWGGIMGCSLAYHLGKEGETDIVLLGKSELTSGSTWHAARQTTHSASHYSLARMAVYGTDLYPQLENETGQSCSWHGCGSLRLAYLDAEVDWLHYTASIGRGIGHDMEIIQPDRIRKLYPFYRLDGVKAALHTKRWPC